MSFSIIFLCFPFVYLTANLYCICTWHFAFDLLLCYSFFFLSFNHIPVTSCFCLCVVGQRAQNHRNISKIGIHRQVNICGVLNQNLWWCKSYKYSTVRVAVNTNCWVYQRVSYISFWCRISSFPLNRWPSSTCHGCSTLCLAATRSTVYCM